MEGFRGLDGLIENLHSFTACDDDGSGQVERVMQAFHRSDSLALQDVSIAHRFHSQNADAMIDQFWEHHMFEAAEVCVHQIERHLASIEMKLMLRRYIQHSQMDQRIFVSRETDVADLT